MTWTVKEHDDILPCISVTTALTTVDPTGKSYGKVIELVPTLYVVLAIPQLSVDAAAKLNVALQLPASVVYGFIGTGHSMAGFS